MKQTFYYIFKGDDPNKVFYENHKNSLYEIKNNKIFFKSHFYEEIEVKPFYVIPDLDEKFYNEITKFIKLAIKDAQKLSDEPIEYNDLSIEKIRSIIYSKIIKYSHIEENSSIFDFLTEIFISCLMNHTLKNGNKRFSLCFLILILESFGYYFSWSKGIWKDYSKHENKIAEFVDKMKNNQIEENFLEIKTWIKYNIVISIPK